MTEATETLLKRICRVLERYPSVEAAYLFGSHAEGRARSDSDVDVGLVGPRVALGACRLDMLADLAAEGVDRVDLVLLEGADLVLQFEAMRQNRLIHARPGFDHGGYFSRTIREYFDLEPYLCVQRQALKRRLLHGKA